MSECCPDHQKPSYANNRDKERTTWQQLIQQSAKPHLEKLLPQHNKTVPEVAAEEFISKNTQYIWLYKPYLEGKPLPGQQKNAGRWSESAEFAIVLETACLSAVKVSHYC